VEGGHQLADYLAGFVGYFVDDPDSVLDPVGRVDDRGHHRDLPAQVEEPVAVRRMVP